MACQTGCLTGDTLHEASITSKDCNVILVLALRESGMNFTISIIANQIKTAFVVYSSKMSLSHCHANAIGETLAKGAGCNLNACLER
jgi:hypothetical protein